jgi:uncharacterized protein (TIGR03067 family)
MSLRVLSIVCVLPALGFAPAPLPRPSRGPAQGDLKKLQGEWVIVEDRRGGRKIDGAPDARLLSISRDCWTFSSDGRVDSRWKARLDPSATPRTVDLIAVDGEGIDRVLALYRFEGDTLYIAYDNGGDNRPTNFDSGWVMVLKRR